MVTQEDLKPDAEFKVIANKGGHEFRIGEVVRFSHDDGDESLSLVCYHLDGSDYWYMYPEELEVI